mmetsp:Transcript_2469/g.5709  ORF Transcript_2469/g.5709 Transcript_2469/m.5709 type:complete len:398 (-) Transcript_2469:21-1214(-)
MIQADKSQWKCFHLPDGSYYYGEVAYQRPGGDIVEQHQATAEEQNSLKKLRHGLGVQVFTTQSGDLLCKYEGHWHADSRHGTGTCYYPDGSVFVGSMASNKKSGFGKYTWADGKYYEGSWKEDRMEGSGVFKQAGGFTMRGQFKNNYHVRGDYLVNPFLSQDEIEADLVLQKKYRAERARREEAISKAVVLQRIPNLSALHATVEQSLGRGRVPIIITTQQSFLRKSEVYEVLKKTNPSLWEVDLRHMSVLKREEGKEASRLACRTAVKGAFTSGGVLVLNIDDSEVRYEELYDPDLHDIIHVTSFPSLLFKPDEFKNKFEVWKAFRSSEETLRLDKNTKFVIWSKFRLDEMLDDQDVLAKFEKRFGKSLSLDSIDLILVHSQIDEDAGEVADKSML